MAGQTVVGQLGRGAVGIGGQQPGVGGVQPHLLARQQVAVDRLLQQRMAKRVAPGGGVGRQHPGADRLVQALLQLGLGLAGNRGEQPVGHPAAGHRRHPQHLLGRLRQPLDPGQQHLDEGRRQLDPGVAGPGGQQLLGVERVALRAGVDALHLLRRQRRSGDRLQVLGQLGPGERGQLQPLHRRQPDQLGQQRPQRVPPVQLVGPVADDQRHLARPQGAGQEGDQVPGGAVGPVQVLQHQRHRGPFGEAHQHGPHGVEHLQLVQAVAGEPGRLDPGQEPAEGGRGHGRTGQQPGLLRVVGELAQGVHHGQIGKADVAQLDGCTHQHPRPALTGPVGKRQQQARLAHPGVTGKQHHLRAALLGPFQQRVEPAQLHRPADERRTLELPCHARQYGATRGKRNGSVTSADPVPALPIERRTPRAGLRTGCTTRRRRGARSPAVRPPSP